MAIVNIKRMSIIALQKDRNRIVKLLQKLGIAEIINIKDRVSKEEWDKVFVTGEHSKKLIDLQNKLSDIQFALDFMSRYSKSKKSLFAEKPPYREDEIERLSQSQEIWDIVKECRQLESKLNSLKSEEMKLNNTIEALKPWEGLDIPVAEIKATDMVRLYPGTLPEDGAEGVIKALLEQAPESHLEVVSADGEFAYVLLIYHKSLEQEVSNILKESSWSKVDLPRVEGTPLQAITSASEKMEEYGKIRQEIADKAISLSESRLKLEFVYDYYNTLVERSTVAAATGETSQAFYMEGWVPDVDTEGIKEKILKKVSEAYIAFSDPEEDDDVPVVLDNPRIVQPFELITDLYSPPGKSDIDPNKIMAPFYVIFFGMMLSDAGYGIILALTGFWVLRTVKPIGVPKKLFEMIAYGGVSTIFWGAMFGSWFGDLIHIPAIWMYPLEEPMKLLVFSLILGVIQIYVGLGAMAYRNIRAGKVLDAIYDQGLWYLLLTGLMLFAIPSTAGIAKILSIMGAIGLVLTQGRAKKNIVGKLTSGVLSLYGVTGYLSDVLSYSRILALGLATGVIAIVVNTMARMLGFNIIGYLLVIVVLIVGHIFNIAINALGAYVHSSRLQYVEFFSKFYDGGGRAFKPFMLKTKYTKLQNEEEF